MHPASDAARDHHDRRWLILAVIGVAQLLVVLDVTIVNIALPSAQRDLGFSDDDRQWVITGPGPLVPAGMALAALGIVLLTRIGIDTAYASYVLPSLILIGTGVGLVLAPALATATYGVPARDSGVASAMVNTSQQVGGAIGTALLSTLAVSSANEFVADRGRGRSCCARPPSRATSPRSGGRRASSPSVRSSAGACCAPACAPSSRACRPNRLLRRRESR